MLNSEVPSDHAKLPDLRATLWRCGHCNSFISIHSAQPVEEALCPACGVALLDLCGTFDSILGLQFANA